MRNINKSGYVVINGVAYPLGWTGNANKRQSREDDINARRERAERWCTSTRTEADNLADLQRQGYKQAREWCDIFGLHSVQMMKVTLKFMSSFGIVEISNVPATRRGRRGMVYRLDVNAASALQRMTSKLSPAQPQRKAR